VRSDFRDGGLQGRWASEGYARTVGIDTGEVRKRWRSCTPPPERVSVPPPFTDSLPDSLTDSLTDSLQVDGSPVVSVRSGASLLEGARRRALQAALQPHPSAPPPSAVERALIAPTKRHFWSYVKGRAAAAMSMRGGGGGGGGGGSGGGGGRSPGAVAGAGAATSETRDRAPAVISTVTSSAPAAHDGVVDAVCSPIANAVRTAGDWGSPIVAAVPAEQLARSRVVLWAPSFRDPRVMPFLDRAVRAALLHGKQSPPRPPTPQQAQPFVPAPCGDGCADQLTLYRGILHPELTGLAFVGYEVRHVHGLGAAVHGVWQGPLSLPRHGILHLNGPSSAPAAASAAACLALACSHGPGLGHLKCCKPPLSPSLPNTNPPI
jgi:hypothetical protein